MLLCCLYNLESKRKYAREQKCRRQVNSTLKPSSSQMFAFKFNIQRGHLAFSHYYTRTFKTITIVNYYTDYYNSPLIQFFKSGHISRCQSTAYKSYNKCDRLATVGNCVLTHTHQSFKKWLLMGGPKKGIHHFLKWPPFATMPGGLYCLQGFVRIAGQFIKCILVLLFYDFFFFLLHTSENLSYQISYQRDFYL